MTLNGTVPTWVMALAAVVLTACLIVGIPLAGWAGRRRGRRLAHPEAFTATKEKAKDTALFLAALLPSLLVWLAVMAVSFIGLTGFARSVLQWDHWTNMLVPLSLDGISVSFGAWAFVAVKRGRHPGRAYKIVLAAAAMSAMLNFVHGRNTWSLWAGLYLAFLSFAGMAMFHELLDQFMSAYDDDLALKSRYPRFGQRWLYAPFSTFAARKAWIVHPPRDPLPPSVRNALGHLEWVREDKRRRKLGGALLVREEQQARLLEVLARNEVKAARRGDLGPPLESLAAPLVEPPVPPAPAVKVKPAARRTPKARTPKPEPELFTEPPAPEPEPEPVVLPPVQAQIYEILDAHLRPGDDLVPDHLMDGVLRLMTGPASRSTVHEYIALWVDEIRSGRRPLHNGPGLPVPQPNPTAGKGGYPFEVLALRPVTIGGNVVACAGCGTEATLQFSGLHTRRPVEATCGCGQRWQVVGLGSTRVWEVLSAELAAGHAERLPTDIGVLDRHLA